jgi:hypothetical protein
MLKRRAMLCASQHFHLESVISVISSQFSVALLPGVLTDY